MKKNYFLTLIFLLTSFFTVSAQCDHTFVMNDSWGDGWNGASVDIFVDGVLTVAAAANAETSSEEISFTASTDSDIALDNWVSGSYDGEISWLLLDGAGTELAAGSFGDLGAGVGYCPPPPTCDHTFVMNDAWGDGWNGSTVDLSVDGEVVAAAITAADAGQSNQASTEDFVFSAVEGAEITLTNWTTGSYTSEVSWSIVDGAGLELASGFHGEVAAVEANCTEPACYSPEITAWTMNATGVEFDGTNSESITSYTVEYSEATFTPGDGSAMSYTFESFPASLDGLTPATTYYFAMQSNCGEGISSDYIPSNDAPAEWTTSYLPPENDLCENAIPVADGDVIYGTTNGATDDANVTSNTSGDVWYTYESTSADDVTITTCGSPFDTYLRVFDSCTGEQISYNDDMGSECASNGLNSQLTFANDGVSTYHIMVEGFSSNVGDFTLSVSSTLGVEDNEIEDLRIYPNPVVGNYVTIATSMNGDKFVEVFDINGRKVISTTLFNDDLDVTNLVSGFYTARVTIAGKTSVSKLIVK